MSCLVSLFFFFSFFFGFSVLQDSKISYAGKVTFFRFWLKRLFTLEATLSKLYIITESRRHFSVAPSWFRNATTFFLCHCWTDRTIYRTMYPLCQLKTSSISKAPPWRWGMFLIRNHPKKKKKKKCSLLSHYKSETQNKTKGKIHEVHRIKCDVHIVWE